MTLANKSVASMGSEQLGGRGTTQDASGRERGCVRGVEA